MSNGYKLVITTIITKTASVDRLDEKVNNKILLHRASGWNGNYV